MFFPHKMQNIRFSDCGRHGDHFVEDTAISLSTAAAVTAAVSLWTRLHPCQRPSRRPYRCGHAYVHCCGLCFQGGGVEGVVGVGVGGCKGNLTAQPPVEALLLLLLYLCWIYQQVPQYRCSLLGGRRGEGGGRG